MRRTALTIDSLSTADLCALSLTRPAVAAEGTLVVSGMIYTNPHGCYVSKLQPMTVQNRTDTAAFIYSGPGCRGSLIKIASPGTSLIEGAGKSARVS